MLAFVGFNDTFPHPLPVKDKIKNNWERSGEVEIKTTSGQSPKSSVTRPLQLSLAIGLLWLWTILSTDQNDS
jgi:hypothetical protein